MTDKMKFPYGLADFSQIRSEGYVYVDRTGYIPVLEEMGRHLFFVRPRRFGKSLTVSMLGYYYDAAYRDRFDQLFGGLAIHEDPTERQGTHLVLRLDFSGIETAGDFTRLEQAFRRKVASRCTGFVSRYRSMLERPELVTERVRAAENASGALDELLQAVEEAGRKVYVLIDEYDNFANDLISARRQEHYQQMVRNTGFVKTFFKVLKEYTQVGGGVVDRVFMTGVSPLMLDDLTSGFNITKNLRLDPRARDPLAQPAAEALCGQGQRALQRPDAARPGPVHLPPGHARAGPAGNRHPPPGPVRPRLRAYLEGLAHRGRPGRRTTPRYPPPGRGHTVTAGPIRSP